MSETPDDFGDASPLDERGELACLANDHRQRRLLVAYLHRNGRRRDGQVLSDVAIAKRVAGITIAEVTAIRDELGRTGMIADEIHSMTDDKEKT